jgi:hypothetical protein
VPLKALVSWSCRPMGRLCCGCMVRHPDQVVLVVMSPVPPDGAVRNRSQNFPIKYMTWMYLAAYSRLWSASGGRES